MNADDIPNATARIQLERDDALSMLELCRERMARLFDRHACAACAAGSSRSDCPCGMRRTGDLIDRIDRRLESLRVPSDELSTVDLLVRERDQARVERDNARQLLELSARLQAEAFARGAVKAREAAARIIECSPNGGCFSSVWFDRPCERCAKAERIRKIRVADLEGDPCAS